MATRGRATGRSRDNAGRNSARHPARDAERRPAAVDLAPLTARLHEVIDPLAGSAGYDLEDLSVVRMGRRYVVRVTVDRDGGVGLDAVAELSRTISHALDDAEAATGEFVIGEYQLEVSSRGTDRPLTEPRHWRRNVGRLVAVRPAGGPVTARIVAADDTGATLAVDGAETTFSYEDLGRGRIEVEFSRLDEVDDDDLLAFDDHGDDADVDVSDDDERADVAGLDDDDDNGDDLGTGERAGPTDVGEKEER